MKKLFIFLVKYLPVIQMAGILFNNVMYYFDLFNNISRFIDFIIGNSYITSTLFYICSYMFGFCKWHKLVITANFVNLNIGLIDVIFHIPVTDLQLLMLYFIIDIIFLFIILINKFKCKH